MIYHTIILVGAVWLCVHHNHHLEPANPCFRRAGWELDLGWCYFRILERLGLAVGAEQDGDLRGGDAVVDQGAGLRLHQPFAAEGEAQRERWVDSSGRIDPFRAVFGNGGWAAYTRIAAGLGLVLTALIVFAVVAGQARLAVPVLVAVSSAKL